MTMEWRDYKMGDVLPEGTTHVQLACGNVVSGDSVDGDADIIRYYGPPVPAPKPDVIEPISDYERVARDALDALLKGEPVQVTHPAGYARCGFPLPAKQTTTGELVRYYRPSGVLAWIEERIKK